jgi:hypothetical protein
LDKNDRYSKSYKCPTAFDEDQEPEFKECNKLCPVECEWGLTYYCNGECIPFDKPCRGIFLTIVNRNN